MANKTIAIGMLILVVAVLGFTFLKPSQAQVVTGFEETVTQYKSPGCGCCGIYDQYLRDVSDLQVDVVATDEVSDLKDDYGIPMDMRSCHFITVGDYFVEGHVPIEAIAKLIEEQPDIKGIALPGMPAGSPGMPGAKRDVWTIYGVHHDGSTSEFMKI